MAALSAARYNPTFKNIYQEMKKKGKHSKVALTAVMRRMIVSLNAMVKNNATWDEKSA